MKQYRSVCWAGCVGILMFAEVFAKEAERPGAADKSPQQVEIEVRILEMPPAIVKDVFGNKGPVPGGDVTDDFQKRISQRKGVDLLSAPRVVTLAGLSAQIKVGQEQSFATCFRVVETNGIWEPVFKTVELGIAATVVATPYPNDPARLRGAAEITLSRLVRVSEQTVIPPGNQGAFKMQSPVVETRALTTSFDVDNGKMIVLGGIEQGAGDGAKSTVVLLRASVIPQLP